jgi:hypothetical protein
VRISPWLGPVIQKARASAADTVLGGDDGSQRSALRRRQKDTREDVD